MLGSHLVYTGGLQLVLRRLIEFVTLNTIFSVVHEYEKLLTHILGILVIQRGGLSRSVNIRNVENTLMYIR